MAAQCLVHQKVATETAMQKKTPFSVAQLQSENEILAG